MPNSQMIFLQLCGRGIKHNHLSHNDKLLCKYIVTAGLPVNYYVTTSGLSPL